MTAAARTSAVSAAPELRATIGPTLRRSTERGFAVIGETNLADFFQDAPELWRRREAHGSIRIQEGEPPSPAAILHHSIIVSINGESLRVSDNRKARQCNRRDIE